MNFHGNRIGQALYSHLNRLARLAVAGRIAKQNRKDLLQSRLVKRADRLARVLEKQVPA